MIDIQILNQPQQEFNLDNLVGIALLKKAGIVKVVVSFSGGNDSGGSDDVHGIGADGLTIDILDEKQREHLMQWADENYIYPEYGSFAGEYYASGTVELNLETLEVEFNHSMQADDEYSDEPYED